MAKREGSVWIGCKAQHNLALCGVVQIRKPFSSCFGFTFLKKVGCLFFQNGSNGIQSFLARHAVGLSDLFGHQPGHGLAVLLEVVPHPHDSTYD